MKAFNISKYLAAVVNGGEGIVVVERLAEALGIEGMSASQVSEITRGHERS
ncbi:MAG: hypothetical protein ACLP3R_10715 [Candidatus Korobacteraceae bacterium]